MLKYNELHFGEWIKERWYKKYFKPLFEYDIYGCPEELKGQLKIGDFT